MSIFSRKIRLLTLIAIMALVATLAATVVFGAGGGGQNGIGFRALSGEEAANFVVPDDMDLVKSFRLSTKSLSEYLE